MLGLLFNPSGRLGRAGFLKGALVLIVIGAILSVVSTVNLVLLLLLGAAYLLLVYPWAVIWIKRFHDSGKSGWMFLLALVAWLVISNVASLIITAVFGPSVTAEPGQPVGVVFDAMLAATRATVVPSTIIQALISLGVVYGANAILRPDPGPNRFGPPPAV